MTDPKTPEKPNFSADWLLQGALSRIGDTLDRFTGRRWTPSSSLATSELIERMKRLMDSEMREVEGKGRVVPHNIKLKVQWDKFAADEGDALDKLRDELLTAAADHINDQLYYTYGPLHVEVKHDYFTEGVKLFVTFDTFDEEPTEAEMNVTLPSIAIPGLAKAVDQPQLTPAQRPNAVFVAKFELRGSRRDRRLEFPASGRLSLGRTSANDLVIDDASISKIHASLVVDRDGGLAVADTGSTNGTFINGERIPYGKAMPVKAGDKVKFGTVEIEFENVTPPAAETAPAPVPEAPETVEIDGLRFLTKTPEKSGERSVINSSDNTLEIDQEPAARRSEEKENE